MSVSNAVLNSISQSHLVLFADTKSMNKPKRECGSCEHWVKWKHDKLGRGLCNLLDLAGPAQYGKNCSFWKGKSYKRENTPAWFNGRTHSW